MVKILFSQLCKRKLAFDGFSYDKCDILLCPSTDFFTYSKIVTRKLVLIQICLPHPGVSRCFGLQVPSSVRVVSRGHQLSESLIIDILIRGHVVSWKSLVFPLFIQPQTESELEEQNKGQKCPSGTRLRKSRWRPQPLIKEPYCVCVCCGYLWQSGKKIWEASKYPSTNAILHLSYYKWGIQPNTEQQNV